jgi:integrase
VYSFQLCDSGSPTHGRPWWTADTITSCPPEFSIAQWHEIVDFAAGGKCVHTITQKTKTEDIIPISDEALQLIGYSPEKTGLVFKGLKRSWTQHPMKEWIREAGITKNITFHSYRRTYATLQGAAGTDIRTIQSNMAHKSITTTQRYMKVVDSNKREASNRISLIRK